MRYHNLKMQEINKIIKELWIKVYRGGGGGLVQYLASPHP